MDCSTQASLSTISQSLLKLVSIESMMTTISSLCHPLLLLLSVSFPMSWLFISGGQSTGAAASMSVLPMNIQGWFPLGLIGLTSLLRDSQSVNSNKLVFISLEFSKWQKRIYKYYVLSRSTNYWEKMKLNWSSCSSQYIVINHFKWKTLPISFLLL